jgi:hypothetical protein
VALVLATGIALAILAVAVGAAAHEGSVSAEESTLISTVLGAAVGALATYLGTRDERHEPPEPPQYLERPSDEPQPPPPPPPLEETTYMRRPPPP